MTCHKRGKSDTVQLPNLGPKAPCSFSSLSFASLRTALTSLLNNKKADGMSLVRASTNHVRRHLGLASPSQAAK